MQKRFFHAIASALGLVAVAVVSTACLWYFHQPKVPQELLK
ncbi:MAG: cyclic lactone autoinducer peptide [Cohnella sp.]|nr:MULTISPECIES: cyclic lactone autoinducer peptide [Cohnella]REK65474.1 MAG: cyclic lactone autoinducer peptide [Cohnella sp.]